MRCSAGKPQYNSAVLILGLVMLIAAYHYVRFFNSGVGACVTLLAALLLSGTPVPDGCS